VAADASAALARVGLDASSAEVNGVDHGALTAGIWRVSVPGRRMILKCVSADRPPARTSFEAHWATRLDDPARWNYWAREGLAFERGVMASYEPSGIVAPKLLAAHHGDRDFVMLLEFVEGVPAEQWSIAEYVRAARALGEAQARHLSDRPVVSYPWLSRWFLREYSSEKPVDWSLLSDDDAWSSPLVARNFPTELREATFWLHSVRTRLYDLAERIPRTLCHLDFWTKNLILRDDGTFALLDWAFVGDGAIGEDIGNLVPDAAFDHFIAAALLPDFHAEVLDGYTEGLREGGWNGDARLVELGMCASAVKYDWLTPWMLASARSERQLRYGGTEEIDADYRFSERGSALLRNAHNARRALSLAAELGI
jgi:hypothetical protein